MTAQISQRRIAIIYLWLKNEHETEDKIKAGIYLLGDSNERISETDEFPPTYY